MLSHKIGSILVTLFLISSVFANPSPINYGNFLGVNPGDPDILNVAEDSSTDPTPLFGAPIRVGNRLLFFPTAFSSYSSNGTADTTSGTLTMTIVADSGYYLEDIIIKEYGDYTLTGAGTAATSATINGLLTVTDIVPGTHIPLWDSLLVSPITPYTLPEDTFGVFTAVTQISLTGLGISQVVLNFNNNLQTSSESGESGTTAFIQKKVIDGPAIVVDVPEPATICLFGLGTFALFKKRRV